MKRVRVLGPILTLALLGGSVVVATPAFAATCSSWPKAGTNSTGSASSNGHWAAWVQNVTRLDTGGILADGASVPPGVVVRGELHICSYHDGGDRNHAGKIHFKMGSGSKLNPSWNDHDYHAVTGGKDSFVSTFFQVIPATTEGKNVELTPKVQQSGTEVYESTNPFEILPAGTPQAFSDADGPGNAASCSTGKQAFIVNVTRQDTGASITSGTILPEGTTVRGEINICSNVNHLSSSGWAAGVKFVPPARSATMPWEDEPFIRDAVSAGVTLTDTTTFYQTLPRGSGQRGEYEFYPRFLSRQGPGPDDNIMAQGPTFIVCVAYC